jgi:hypothetical protein
MATEAESLNRNASVASTTKNSKVEPLADLPAASGRTPIAASDAHSTGEEGEGVLERVRLDSRSAMTEEKLVPASGRRPANPAKPRARARPKKRDSARAFPKVVEVEAEMPAAPANAERLRECEVRCAPSADEKSLFSAVATRADGAEVTIAESRSFRWPKSEPPVAMPLATTALRELVKTLERDGWEVAGRGGDWFAFRLARRAG